MTRLRAGALVASLALAVIAAPRGAVAQPAQQPATASVVVVLPFRGNATQDVIDDAEAVVRNALMARGSRVPDRTAVNAMMGVAAPTDPQSIAGFGRTMNATQVITASVQPLSGQYNLTLTLTDVATARVATQHENVGYDTASETVSRMLVALFDPAALGPPPVDPEEERRRQEAERQRVEAERQRAEAERRRQETERRRAEEERRRRYDRDNPERGFDHGGPWAIGASLQAGALVSSTREAPTMPRPGAQLSDPSVFAFGLRAEGAYSIRAVRGLEVVASVLFMTTPSTALTLGGGAQFNLPAVSRGRIRGVGGALIGLYQGVSGARITTAWISAFARAEYSVAPEVALTAGIALDAAPGGNGGVVTLAATVGARFHLGR